MRKIKWYIIAFALLLTACKSASLQEEAKGKYGQVELNDAERAEVDSMVNGVAFRLVHEMQKNQLIRLSAWALLYFEYAQCWC